MPVEDTFTPTSLFSTGGCRQVSADWDGALEWHDWLSVATLTAYRRHIGRRYTNVHFIGLFNVDSPDGERRVIAFRVTRETGEAGECARRGQ